MASQFPDDFPTYDPFSTPITLAALQHTARHRQMEQDIVALATKLGKDEDDNPDSIDYMIRHIDLSDKISYSEDSTTNMDFVLDEDDFNSDSDTKLATQASIKAYVDAAILANNDSQHPVGSLYFNADDPTNPEDLLGYGEWEEYAKGRVPVGIDSTQTEFDTAGETGGAKTHTLTVDQIPSHNHEQFVTANSGGTGVRRDYNQDGSGYQQYTQGINTGNRGGGQAHNNLQPYIVVYIWRRTA